MEFIKLMASVAEDGLAEVDGVELVTAAAMTSRREELAVVPLILALIELEDTFARDGGEDTVCAVHCTPCDVSVVGNSSFRKA